GRAVKERYEKRVVEAEREEQPRHAEDAVVWRDLRDPAPMELRRLDAVPMEMHDALRPTGRAAGVLEERHLARARRVGRDRVGLPGDERVERRAGHGDRLDRAAVD